MPAYKDKAKGTWYASFYYEDWTGKKVKKMKRGFPTKREALEWERTFLQQQTADLEMTFENFVAVYVADMKGRIKENTWGTKEHKKEQRAKEIAELEAVKAKKQGQVERQEQRLKELAPAVRNMEQLAAQFSDDPERILPEPGPLESAKSYREKKAKPLLAQIVKVLRSLYRAYVELKRKYERLQGDYGRAREGNERLSDRLQETKLENKALRGAVADFERVKRAFGPEEVERAVEDAKRREAQEREQKKAKRRFRRGAR